ncbi:MAG TPA: aryl-sulfate sulfotransferase [Anaerolineae bacterium]|nr:aryl-sulfate sulfotransferase [Anaerolineae bacterium]
MLFSRVHRSMMVIVGLVLLVVGYVGWASVSASASTGVNPENYYLFTPLTATDSYLMDDSGEIVHTWSSSYISGKSAYLMEDGTLLRTGETDNPHFTVGGKGGIVEAITPDNEIVWSFEYSNEQYRLHHDIEILPNGNILMIAWEKISGEEAIAAGRDPEKLTEGELWPDKVIEVNPETNEIVWEWRAWDHLVQDFDETKPNYGVVSEHPELIDLNYNDLDYDADWHHVNGIAYNEELDQIMLTVHHFSEIWVIDHSTTITEAAGHEGGIWGQGGDLLYRWGNPEAYGRGTEADQKLFVPHNGHWIAEGLPGAGNILIFNNGNGRLDENYSSIEEITPPVDGDGRYLRDSVTAYGPEVPTWQYVAPNRTDFYASFVSGVQRLANGNTLICSGPQGYFFEVTAEGETVWDYDSEEQIFRVRQYDGDYGGVMAVLRPYMSYVPVVLR